MPERIQRRRTAGWRMPQGAIYVGRPTKWGNPFRVGQPSAYWMGPGLSSPFRPNPVPKMDAEHVTAAYRNMVKANCARFSLDDLDELRGHDLACWCPLVDEHGNRVPCHADVLLELANLEVAAQHHPVAGVVADHFDAALAVIERTEQP